MKISLILAVQFFFIISIGEAQIKTEGKSERFMVPLISATPQFSGGATFGIQQEWGRFNQHFSITLSADFETRINTYQGERTRYNAYYLRPGVRYYYKKNNTGFFHGASLLAAYEENPMPWKSAFGYGAGLSVLGFRHTFKNRLILEVDGFAGFGQAHITDYNSEQFIQGRYYYIGNLRIGYRLN